MMHDKIEHNLLCREFTEVNYDPIYVADFTERTKLNPPHRSVEVSNTIQPSPDGMGDMDSVIFHNANHLYTEFAMFDDDKYVTFDGSDIRHCECAMYLSRVENIKWIAFLELKDCKSKNLSRYKDDVKEQIKLVVKDFKNRGFITDLKIFGIASFPRRKTSFNDTMFSDTIAATIFKRDTGINFFGTNEVFIMSKEVLRPEI